MAKGKTLVIGDFILDEYIFGSVEKISPEAPVPEFVLNGDIEYKAGGAGNVACILHGLEVETYLVGQFGSDEKTMAFLDTSLPDDLGLWMVNCRQTITKTRFIDSHYNQHILRVALEHREDLDDRVEMAVKDIFAKQGPFETVIFSDYDKGLLTEKTIWDIRGVLAQIDENIAVLADPKIKNWRGYGPTVMRYLPDLDCVTPNHREIAEIYGVSADEVYTDAVHFADKVVSEQQIKTCIITLGAMGAAYCTAEGPQGHIPTRPREVFDVTGAGDTFFAVVSYLWGRYDIEEIIHLANEAAGQTVQGLGNQMIDKRTWGDRFIERKVMRGEFNDG